MKRISFLFTVLLCMLLPVSVYAAAEAGMFDADARLTVTGTAPSGTADVSVSVLDNNFTIQDADNVKDGAVVYTNQIKPNKDGEFSLADKSEGLSYRRISYSGISKRRETD